MQRKLAAMPGCTVQRCMLMRASGMPSRAQFFMQQFVVYEEDIIVPGFFLKY